LAKSPREAGGDGGVRTRAGRHAMNGEGKDMLAGVALDLTSA
jgi:hypothetical protein